MIKLFPVIEWLMKGRDKLSVPMHVPTHKKVGVAFAKTNLGVCDAVNSVLHNSTIMASSLDSWHDGFSTETNREVTRAACIQALLRLRQCLSRCGRYGRQNDPSEVVSIYFKESPPRSALDWHDAPERQYVITLSGTLEFTTRDGETFVLRPGDVLLAADRVGSGHKWRLIDDQPWRRAMSFLSRMQPTHLFRRSEWV